MSSAVHVYDQLIRPGELCFDIGAHCGAKTQMTLERGARVVAVEPQPWRAAELQNRFAANDHVTVVEAAVSSASGRAGLAVCDQADTISTISGEFCRSSRFATRAYTWGRTIEVNVTTIDQLIASYGLPVFCKIDVEWHELAVLRGLRTPVQYLSFEFSEECASEIERCLDELGRLSAIECNVVLGEGSTFAYADWCSANELVLKLPTLETLCSRKPKRGWAGQCAGDDRPCEIQMRKIHV